MTGSSQAWNLTSRLGWLAGTLCGICLSLPLLWNLSMWHLVWLFIWVLGIKHGSSRLHGKHFTNWAILSGPVYTLLTEIEGNHKSGVEIESRELSHPHHRKFRNCTVTRNTTVFEFIRFHSSLSPPWTVLCYLSPGPHFQRWVPFKQGFIHGNQNQLKIPMDCLWGTFIALC